MELTYQPHRLVPGGVLQSEVANMIIPFMTLNATGAHPSSGHGNPFGSQLLLLVLLQCCCHAWLLCFQAVCVLHARERCM